MPRRINITNKQRRYILENYSTSTAIEMSIAINLSRETIWKLLRSEDKSCKRSYERKYIAIDKNKIAETLESFATNGYSVKLAAKSSDISYSKASWYIKHHYTKKMRSESTQVLTIQSAV